MSASPSSRQRGKTIDDDAIPNNLVSPAKLVALREKKSLGHSRSSSDLRRVPEDASCPEEANATDARGTAANDASKTQDKSNGAPKTPPRPSIAKLRRRSTLEWANASPQSRQEKLESMTAERMADVFFSLHISDIEGESKTVPMTIIDDDSELTDARTNLCLRSCESHHESNVPLD